MREVELADIVLWGQFKNGDKQSFALIYQKNIAALLQYGCKFCDDTTALKDTIQDLFIELWNSRSQLADVDNIKFYLFKAMRFKLIRLEKKQQASNLLSQSLRDNIYGGMDKAVEDKIIEDEVSESQMEILQKAMDDLSVRQKEVIQLRFYQGFTHQQIAELMHLNYQSVSNLLHTAILRIRETFKAPAFTEYALYR